MNRIASTVWLSAMLVVWLTSAAAAAAPRGPASASDDQPISDIRDVLLRLPYYGVFDFLTFSVEKGTVTLAGYAYQPGLIEDAERAVKRVSGVDSVIVKVTELPVSRGDDAIRWGVFYAIYTNDFLSRYAPGGGILWGHRHPFRSFMTAPWPDFPGMQPVGNYPIHVVVEHGRVRLLGMVDNEADKTVAGMAARGVGGTFGVENELVIDTGGQP